MHTALSDPRIDLYLKINDQRNDHDDTASVIEGIPSFAE